MGKTIKSNVRKLLQTMISKFNEKQKEKEVVFQEKQQCLDTISGFLDTLEDIQGLCEIKSVVETLKNLEKKSLIETQTKYLEEISSLTIDKFKKRCDVNNINLRNKHKLVLNSTRLTKISKSFACNCIRFYNKLPQCVSGMSFNKLKEFVKPKLINKAYYNIKEYISDTSAWE